MQTQGYGARPAQPPADPNVKLRIDKMAEYIVRNGPQFEASTLFGKSSTHIRRA